MLLRFSGQVRISQIDLGSDDGNKWFVDIGSQDRLVLVSHNVLLEAQTSHINYSWGRLCILLLLYHAPAAALEAQTPCYKHIMQ